MLLTVLYFISFSFIFSMNYNNFNNCLYKTNDNICYGNEIKLKYFLLNNNYTNLNHGTFFHFLSLS